MFAMRDAFRILVLIWQGIKMQSKSYKLAQYCIIEKGNGEIWWETHGGVGSLKKGKCFVQGDILFIGPPEAEEAGFLKREFLEKLRKYPQWTKTKYYCSSYSIRECSPGNSRHKSAPIESNTLDRKDRRPNSEPDRHFANEMNGSTQSHTARMGDLTEALAKGVRSVKSRLQKVKFRREEKRAE